jgi:hypothetical protein
MSDYHQFTRKKPLIDILIAKGIKYTSRTTVQQMKDLIDAHIEKERKEYAQRCEADDDNDSDTINNDPEFVDDDDMSFCKKEFQKIVWQKIYNCPFYVDSFMVDVYALDSGFDVPAHTLVAIKHRGKFWVRHNTYENKKIIHTTTTHDMDHIDLGAYVKYIVSESDKTVVSLCNSARLISAYRTYYMRNEVDNID